MNLQRNYYEVLGLPPSASTSEIKNKYRELAKKFHPDLTQDKVLGQRIFAQINQAYRVLGDTERRSQYDATLVPERGSQLGMPNGGASGVQSTVQSQDATATPPPVARPMQSQVSPQVEAEVQRLLGEAEMAMMGGRIKETQAICEAILRMQPDNVKTIGILGDVFAQQGDRNRAIETYRVALKYGSSPMIQSKLARLTEAPAPSAGTPPPAPKSAPQPEKSGGLLNRLFGRS